MPATVQHSNEPYHRLRDTSLLLSDETVSTVPSPLDSPLDSAGIFMATRQGEQFRERDKMSKLATALRRTFPRSLGGEGEC
jgi:hypothetical protein